MEREILMGSDLYLSWKGMTEKEKKKQYTGWSIDAGKFGYLRASIGMTTENAVLRMVFPDEYWENPSGKPKRFHFTEDGYNKLHIISFLYIRQNLTGTPIKNSEHEKHTEVFKELFKKLAESFDKVIEGNIDCFRSAIMWINSLFSFYELGMEKEKEGKEPKVYISW
jgi:hypothetical protein